LTNACILCASAYSSKNDGLIDCEFRKTLVHHNCCKDRCSLDGSGPTNCRHAKAKYSKSG
jgi:hypothetical protein